LFISFYFLKMSFKNKTVWITGASSGIGEALAYAFAREGVTLILSARKATELERVKANCAGAGAVHVVLLDIGDHKSVFSTVETTLKRLGGSVDVLINNAGLSQRSLTRETAFSVDEQMISVNLLGTIAMTKAILPTMLAQKSGQIVVISSIMGKLGAPLRSSYAAAKHGLHGFFDTLRAETHDEGLRVLLVCPGYVKTNISLNALTADGKAQGTMDAATDKGFTTEEVAKRILSALRNDKEELIIAAGRERLAVYLKRFMPSILSRMVRRAQTT
jgi:dehydrogenase/reductase SDR family member 7B